MKEKLESENLQTITIAENKVVWMDKNEIWINNSMFDIHSKILKNGVYTFTGLYDEKETLLVEKHKRSSEKNNNENKLISQLFKCLQNIFSSSIYCNSETSTRGFHVNNFLTPPLANPFLARLTPPPQYPLLLS
jgi:hypothetical protein